MSDLTGSAERIEAAFAAWAEAGGPPLPPHPLAEVERLRAAVALHQPVIGYRGHDDFCGECESAWPCPTARVASGEGE